MSRPKFKKYYVHTRKKGVVVVIADYGMVNDTTKILSFCMGRWNVETVASFKDWLFFNQAAV